MAGLQTICIVSSLIAVLFLTGALATRFLDRENLSFSLALVYGFCIVFALFELLAVPMTFKNVPFTTLAYTWGIMILVLSVLSVLWNRGRLIKIIKNSSGRGRELFFLKAAVIVLILFQAYILFRYVHYDEDDAFFIASAVTAVEKNSIFGFSAYTGEAVGAEYNARYILSPLPIVWASISQIFGVHAAIVARTVMPVFLVPFVYVVYGLLGSKLFPDRKESYWLFLLFLCILNVFGCFSIYTPSTFLLVRIWQGKAILANIILPLVLYLSVRCMKENGRRADWLMLFCTMTAACLVSSMGIMLTPVLLGVMGTIYALKNRNLKQLALAFFCCIPCFLCGLVYIIKV